MGELGNPKFDVGDVVAFIVSYKNAVYDCVGSVEIVDAYGTFEQNTEPSYDVMVEDFAGEGKCLIKHVRESSLNSAWRYGE